MNPTFKKTDFIGLRISAKEHIDIADVAKMKGKSLSEYLRLVISISILQNKKPQQETQAKLK